MVNVYCTYSLTCIRYFLGILKMKWHPIVSSNTNKSLLVLGMWQRTDPSLEKVTHIDVPDAVKVTHLGSWVHLRSCVAGLMVLISPPGSGQNPGWLCRVHASSYSSCVLWSNGSYGGCSPRLQGNRLRLSKTPICPTIDKNRGAFQQPGESVQQPHASGLDSTTPLGNASLGSAFWSPG